MGDPAPAQLKAGRGTSGRPDAMPAPCAASRPTGIGTPAAGAVSQALSSRWRHRLPGRGANARRRSRPGAATAGTRRVRRLPSVTRQLRSTARTRGPGVTPPHRDPAFVQRRLPSATPAFEPGSATRPHSRPGSATRPPEQRRPSAAMPAPEAGREHATPKPSGHHTHAYSPPGMPSAADDSASPAERDRAAPRSPVQQRPRPARRRIRRARGSPLTARDSSGLRGRRAARLRGTGRHRPKGTPSGPRRRSDPAPTGPAGPAAAPSPHPGSP